MSSSIALPIAAVLYGPDDPVEQLLAQTARLLVARGVRVGGLVQYDIGATEHDLCCMELEDIAGGQRFSLSQNLGKGSQSCRLDPAALAQAAMAIRQAVAAGVDLVVINKFSSQEVAGSGLRDEMGLVAAAGVPLLTAVGRRFLDQWQEFTGGESALLAPDGAAILAWWQAVAAARGEAGTGNR